MIINSDFKCLPVKLLFHCNYWDGPLSGVCEYQDDKYYFECSDELMFKFAENDPAVVAITDEDFDYHRLRVFTVYKLPEDIMFNIIYNNELFQLVKKSPNWQTAYDAQAKKLPEYFKTPHDFVKEAWQYAIGYTTEDVWDREEYNKKRFKKD